MPPSKDSEGFEESTECGSNVSASNAGSSAETKEQNGSSDLSTSCPAILEPSEDDPLYKREKIRRPRKTYKAIMRSYNSTEIYENSDLSNSWEDGQPRVGCIGTDLFKRYKNFAVKFRNSKLIYIVQILLSLLPFSAFWMGNKYHESCPGSPSLTSLTVVTATFGLLLVGQWMVIKCCSPNDRPCEGQQKYFILVFFILLAFMLELEIYHFIKSSLSFEPSTTNYCNKTFYDYTYYKFIAAFGSMLFAVLLYFPDYRSYASDITCADPITGSCYKSMLEDDDSDA